MKQALTEALIDYNLRDVTPVAVPHLDPIIAAARLVERLLPGECGSCPPMNHQLPPNERPFCICATCHGSGQVWDEGIVEVVADAAIEGAAAGETFMPIGLTVAQAESIARAVLSAIVQLAEAGSQ